jgi:hypothetical protein
MFRNYIRHRADGSSSAQANSYSSRIAGTGRLGDSSGSGSS